MSIISKLASRRVRASGSFPFAVRAATAVVLFGGAAGAALADPSVALDRMSFSAGAFYADPQVQLSGDTNYGHVDTTKQSLDHATIPRVRADVLFGDTQGLSFDYYRYDKSYNPSLSGATVIDGQNVSGTASLDGNLRLDLAQLAYKWWIGSGNDVFGLGAGAAYYRIKLDGTATGTATATGLGLSQTVSGTDSVSESAFAPLLEAGWRHAFAPNVRSYVELSGVKKNGGRINGHIYGGTIGVEWFVAKNVGLVADYGIQKITLHRDDDRAADLDIRLKGPSAYVKVRF